MPHTTDNMNNERFILKTNAKLLKKVMSNGTYTCRICKKDINIEKYYKTKIEKLNSMDVLVKDLLKWASAD